MAAGRRQRTAAARGPPRATQRGPASEHVLQRAARRAAPADGQHGAEAVPHGHHKVQEDKGDAVAAVAQVRQQALPPVCGLYHIQVELRGGVGGGEGASWVQGRRRLDLIWQGALFARGHNGTSHHCARPQGPGAGLRPLPGDLRCVAGHLSRRDLLAGRPAAQGNREGGRAHVAQRVSGVARLAAAAVCGRRV